MIVSKETIEREARAAAQAGKSLNDACPYPFHSPAGMHFSAVYLVATTAQARQPKEAA